MDGIKNTPLLIQIVVGGVLVLSSYAWAVTKKNAMDLWGGVTSRCVRWLWAVSGTTTAFAFLYLSGVFLFEDVDVDYAILNASYAAILVPAALWAYVTFGVLRGDFSMLLLFVNLGAVAGGSLGILFEVVPLDRPLLNAAGAMLVFQHLFLDHIIWFTLFSQWQEDRYRQRLRAATERDELI